jgi:uncharacterized protein
MNDPIEMVVGLVALNDGELVGKVRLQKTFYLLDACGLQSGFDYDFHFYGPFSADLARAADDAPALNRLNFEDKFGYHEVPYRVFHASHDAPPPERLGELSAAEIRENLKLMARYSAAELEVAASIIFLRNNGYQDDPVAETRRRKPATATADRVARAERLIAELRL